MPIPISQQRVLFQRSGNRCAFPDCGRVLTATSPSGETVVLGEMAHIVGESPDGPRGDSSLTPDERNRYENLILLCNTHHQLIDSQPQTYPVERLRAMKEDHESRIEKLLARYGNAPSIREDVPYVEETIHSNLLPVVSMPPFVFGVPCELRSEREVTEELAPLRAGEMAPFILREGMLWVFQDLVDPGNPFRNLARGLSRERYTSEEWWQDPDRFRWYVELLNRANNKLTGRRNLMLDREHRRYYFRPTEPGQPLEVEYRPLNREKARRNAVWQPMSTRTGEGHGYWLHRAVSLRYLYLGDRSWCLSIRPEFHVTKDGVEPLESKKIGAKVTKKKSRMFNYDLLAEVNFWRDYLGGSSPRIVLPFGQPEKTRQRVVISTTLMHADVCWPGIPEQHAKPYKNVGYQDDLFAWAEEAQRDGADEYADGWEDDLDVEDDDDY